MTDTRYSLTELTEAAGVSVRTVRYYVAEGLLPPPVSAGPHSHYTQGHLDRLRLIGRLKEAYLPLREIRRQLAGLDDTEIHHLATGDAEDAGAVMEAGPTYLDASAAPLDSAADYIRRVMGQAAGGRARHPERREMEQHLSRVERGVEDAWHQPGVGRIEFSTPSPQPQAPGVWRRVPLGDDAELLIREDAYQRKADRIDWLVRWARKVFG